MFRATDVSVRVVVSSPDNGPTGWDIHLGLKGSTLSHFVPSPATSDVAQVIIYSSHYYRSSFFVTYISHTSLFTISNTHPLYMHAPHAKTYTYQASMIRGRRIGVREMKANSHDRRTMFHPSCSESCRIYYMMSRIHEEHEMMILHTWQTGRNFE